ncbi:DMT family transporter [Marinactinospora thermotolerans]|uniref:Drug/metabolite transporter, DME family n=1 Tax=Marinactinospora thermotolerans DSM 45154 TaxID=1122192 RepID=A0A1T4SN90_9ACTN|nr:EamA family transporter [Marinactinospora thermotolerans]SKA29754.1 drug/metabolite transporter, DME family [Marinactinospora thermotolerans DSM 45154]
MTATATIKATADSRRRVTGAAAVLGAAALWGTVGPAQVLASSAADPGALGVARLLLGGFALAALCAGGAVWRLVVRREVFGWILLAAAATGVYQVTFMHAVDRLGAALGTTVALGVAPVATGLCARWWTRERLTPGWVAGTVAAVLGCAVLLSPWQSPADGLGVGVALLSGTCYGVYTVAAKRFLQAGAPALPATTLTLLLAGLALSPILVLRPGHLTDVNSLSLIAWTSVAGTAVAYAAFVYGLDRTSAPTAGTLSLAEPLLAAALGILVLGEQLTLPVLLGCLVLISGLVTVTVMDSRLRSRSR